MQQITDHALQVLDPDFPFIAANAALELDHLIHGHAGPRDNLDKLSSLLLSAAGTEEMSNQPISRLLDPVSVDVVRRAYVESYSSSPIAIDELVQDIAEIARDLDEDTASERLKSAKRFCLELSRHSLDRHRAMFHHRSHSPYKK